MMDCFRLICGVAVASFMLTPSMSAEDKANERVAERQELSLDDQVKDLNSMWVNAWKSRNGALSSPVSAFGFLDELKKIEKKYASSASPEIQAEMIKVYDMTMNIYQTLLPDARKLLEIADSFQKNNAGSSSPEVKDYLPYARFKEAEALFYLGASDEAMKICREIRKDQYGVSTDYTLSAFYQALLLEMRLNIWDEKFDEALELSALGYLRPTREAERSTGVSSRIPFRTYINLWDSLIYDKMGRKKEAGFCFSHAINQVEPSDLRMAILDEFQKIAESQAAMFMAMNRFEEAFKTMDDLVCVIRHDQSEAGQINVIRQMMKMSELCTDNLRSSERAVDVLGRIVKQYGGSSSSAVRDIVREVERYKSKKYDGLSNRQMLDKFGDDSEPDVNRVMAARS